MTDCSFPQEKHPFFSRHPWLAAAFIAFGLLLFGETLTWGKAIGLAVVLAGVWLVVSDHE